MPKPATLGFAVYSRFGWLQIDLRTMRRAAHSKLKDVRSDGIYVLLTKPMRVGLQVG